MGFSEWSYYWVFWLYVVFAIRFSEGLYVVCLQDVINPGCGGASNSEYKTLIYYHEDKPKWQEIVKVSCII